MKEQRISFLHFTNYSPAYSWPKQQKVQQIYKLSGNFGVLLDGVIWRSSHTYKTLFSDTLSLAVEKSTTDTNEPIEKPEDAAKEATEPSEIYEV